LPATKMIVKMNPELKSMFEERWRKYFKESPLPVVFFYADTFQDAEYVQKPSGHRCLIADMAKVRKGNSLAFDAQSISCNGGKRYLGFSNTVRPNFEYFLSCGIPGEMEGERYIRTPEQVKTIMKDMTRIPVDKKFIIFRRWDHIRPGDDPQAVIFFARPDVLSGLFTLVNFDHQHGNGVIAPFGAGCASIVHHPWFENQKEDPKAVIGMFDVSARPYVPDDTLTFAVPMKRFEQMIGYMDESFLITDSWKQVMNRIR
jgi:hypothetical protein